jgi:hypothetical protein
LETSELILNRLMGWVKLFAFWVDIPIGIILIGIVLWLGKSVKDFGEFAVVTRTSLQPLLDEARTSADKAKKDALAAQAEAEQVRGSVEPMRQGISDLQNQVTLGLQSLQELTRQMEAASEGVTQLRAKVSAGSEQVSQLRHQVEVVSNEKNLSTLRERYPVFGERVVVASMGERVDAQEKKPEDVYITLLVSMSPAIHPSQRKVNAEDIAAAVTDLQSTGYTVFPGGIGLYARAETSSATVAQMSSQVCEDRALASSLGGPPCILYFRRDLEAVVEKTKQILTPAQAIPDEKIRYTNPAIARPAMQELLEKSGLDIVVVLGQ